MPFGTEIAPKSGRVPAGRSSRKLTSEDASSRPRKRTVAAASEGPALRAWVDGGARGNPGPAGFGAHIEDTDGNLVRELSGFLGHTTNNVAEYGGLVAALGAARELGARSLEVFADSELMVRQMNGQYKVKNEKLKPLFAKAQALASGLATFRIRHVPREKNRDADRLANEAMDRGA